MTHKPIPLCRNCAYIPRLFGEPVGARCQHPAALVIPDPVWGNAKHRTCSEMRAPDGKCGPEGKLWEAK